MNNSFSSEVFLAGDIGECRSHPQEACFVGDSEICRTIVRGGGKGGSGGGDGYYPCCKKPAYRCDERGLLLFCPNATVVGGIY